MPQTLGDPANYALHYYRMINMKKTILLLLILFSLVILFLGLNSNGASLIVKERQRGVSWVAGHESVLKEDFLPLVKNHVNWIVQTPFGWQREFNSPAIRMATDGRVMWGERDAGLEITTRLAKQLGIKTLLKPHIWMRPSSTGKWRSDIEMGSEEDWQSWFEDYRKFILHYAKFAQKNGIEALCIGTELHQTAVKREKEWREIISEIRQVYDGKLTYAANWYREFEEIKFWNELDFIGIQAYFPLAKKENPTLEELKSGWLSHMEAIEEVSKKYNIPVVFTEIGYRSDANAAIRPWEWPARRSREMASGQDLQTQANCYEAFFQVFWGKEWVAGAYFWKWFPKRRNSDHHDKRFTPQGKPAEQVMAKWYSISQ